MVFDKIKSYAKINLALYVNGKNSNLHKIETIVAFISLHDQIFIRKIKSSNHKIKFYGKFSKNIGKNNTVSKLLNILDKKKVLGNKKFSIRIKKEIPNKAGLGGGSMNAATILKYFIDRGAVKNNYKEILSISELIGSDVKLGLKLEHSILTSKNEIKSFKKLKTLFTLVMKPNFGCSTKEIYSKVRKFSKPKFIKPSRQIFHIKKLKKFENSLQPIVFNKYPKLRELYYDLENSNKPIFVRMTGSGSALIAYFKSQKICNKAKQNLMKKYKNYWCIVSKTI